MKSLRLYLIILGLLIALSAWFLHSRRSGSYKPSKIEFAVPDTGKISSVRISSPAGQVELEKNDGTWLVNGAAARKEAVRGLSVLLSRIEVEAPVSRAIQERVHEGFREKSTGVTIFMTDGREKEYKVWFDSLAASTFMMLDGSDEAFRVRVRGYRQLNIAGLYVPDARYWRDNIIFHSKPDGIRAVALQNNQEPHKSFQLARNDGGEFEVAGGIIPGSWSPASAESLQQYLAYFFDVRFERFMNPVSDSLYHREEPDFLITLDLIEGGRQFLELYPVYHIQTSGDRQLEVDLLYGRIGDMNEWIVIKYVQVDPLLQDFEYFK